MPSRVASFFSSIIFMLLTAGPNSWMKVCLLALDHGFSMGVLLVNTCFLLRFFYVDPWFEVDLLDLQFDLDISYRIPSKVNPATSTLWLHEDF